nr:PREDICTED: putative tetratricopeptide repeat protein 41 [Latimeria chalumnae]|eukprot:XP_014348829.1 PREDICTED: putative tetratricopeptide repeat protein 41 [Latimeria chalumnae]
MPNLAKGFMKSEAPDHSCGDIGSRSSFRFVTKPPIKPYMCSTLEEFPEERDHLLNVIFPQLNKLCNARGTYFRAVDLQSSAADRQQFHPHKISKWHHRFASQRLKVSLDYINSCSPFFICLLGQKYGEHCQENENPLPAFIEDISSLSKVEQNLYVAARNGYAWVLQGGNQACSLAELEIIQAAFLNDSQFNFFYFREYDRMDGKALEASGKETENASQKPDENEYEELKLSELKARIVSNGLPVVVFRNLQELGELVLKDWAAVIEKCYPLSSVPRNLGHEDNLEYSYHEAFAQSHCKVFVPSGESEKIFELLEAFALSAAGDIQKESHNSLSARIPPSNVWGINPRSKANPVHKNILLLCGERGCGKSTLLTNWQKSFRRKHPEALVIPHYVGSSSTSNDISSFLRRCISELRHNYFDTEDEGEADSFSETLSDLWTFPLAVQAFIASLCLKPCILVLDGADELTGTCGLSAQQVKMFSWLPQPLPPQCKLILTTVSSDLSCKSIAGRQDVQAVQVTNTSDSRVRSSMLQGHLPALCKEMEEGHVISVLHKKLSLSPLYLAMLASELGVCGLFRRETECLEGYLEAQSLQGLWALILKRWMEDYSWVVERRSNSRRRKRVPSFSQGADKGMSGWVADALCLLSVSRCGLAEQDILSLLKELGYRGVFEVSAFDWAVFCIATMKWIQERPDGLLYFTHQSLKDAVDHKLLGVLTSVCEPGSRSFRNPLNSRKKSLHWLLTQYFQQQDSFRRTYQELPWHMKMCANLGDLLTFISNPRIIYFVSHKVKYENQLKVDLVHYWQVLSQAGYEPAMSYVNAMREMTTDTCSDPEGRKSMVTFLGSCEDSDSDLDHGNERTCNAAPHSDSQGAGAECEEPRDSGEQSRLIYYTAGFLSELGKDQEAEELFLAADTLLSKVTFFIFLYKVHELL